MGANISDDGKKARLLAELGAAVRAMSAQGVMVSQAVASRFGLNTTDLECLDALVMKGGEATVGELGQATGLTSGATTTLLDRLTKAGYVERAADPHDRRKVGVRIRKDAIAPIQAIYAPLASQMDVVWSRYSVEDLAIILDFMTRATAVTAAWMQQLHAASEPAGTPRSKRGRPAKPVAPPSSS
ncbi:MarR family winged helix-turn-helix transcriptional regulator [Mesorhizobium australicum]|uniref:DNA-binding transcriptional regulator, MarR family n=1 Tax=Mesorhizobium australicum TaxID=536018 RepID=A0A1X7Q0X5_9HYPH|nr:MarR family transcriptional regulator [Mesorhizobium australicum]SMH57380.1 DNA-binding transcriptional regulator, MarR family [Mesorhizobium australicum]